MAMNSKTLVKENEFVHTNIPGEAYRKLKKYGDGYINRGIIRLIDAAELNWKVTSRLCCGCGRLERDICTLIGAKPTFSEKCEYFRR